MDQQPAPAAQQDEPTTPEGVRIPVGQTAAPAGTEPPDPVSGDDRTRLPGPRRPSTAYAVPNGEAKRYLQGDHWTVRPPRIPRTDG